MTENREPTANELNGVKQNTVHWPASAHRVLLIDSNGNVSSPADVLTERWEWDGSGRVVYHGEADPGTLDSASTWRISKFSYTGASFNPNDKKWADGTSAFEKVWDDRGTYSY